MGLIHLACTTSGIVTSGRDKNNSASSGSFELERVLAVTRLISSRDSNGDTVEFWFSERTNLTAAKRFLRNALKRHGRPDCIAVDDSQTNREAILSCDTIDRLQGQSRRKLKPFRIRQSAYLNNRIEQDHRAIKRRIRPMLGFKSMTSARVILGRIELVHMMRKGQAKYAHNLQLSLPEQFDLLAA